MSETYQDLSTDKSTEEVIWHLFWREEWCECTPQQKQAQMNWQEERADQSSICTSISSVDVQ